MKLSKETDPELRMLERARRLAEISLVVSAIAAAFSVTVLVLRLTRL